MNGKSVYKIVAKLTSVCFFTCFSRFRAIQFVKLNIFLFSILCCDVHYDFCITTAMLGSSMPPVVCRRSLIYVFFCLRIGLSNTYCVAVFRYVCLPVVSCVPYVASLDCLFLIVPLGFSDVYFLQSTNSTTYSYG